VLPANATLMGKRIVISPGHGWYLDESCSCWKLQRSYFWDIVEDFVNSEITMYLNDDFISAGADVRPARNMNKSAGIGETGHQKWEEGAKYYTKSIGAPSSVWNSSPSDYDKDINSRPLYANWVNSDILVSIHNNGGVGWGQRHGMIM
jgi:N-acetylmuramoyl-L-alanine amidase